MADKDSLDNGIKEIYDLFMFLIIRVATDVERRSARRVLGELETLRSTNIHTEKTNTNLVSPQITVGRALINPVLAH